MDDLDTDSRYRMLTPEQILSWSENDAQILRLRADRDILPGGYMAAAIPALVDWSASDLNGDSPFFVLRNINCGGNPFEKCTVLHSIRVPFDGLEYVELTLVPFGEGGRLSPLQHVQLRFVFEEGKEPELMEFAGVENGTDPHIPDLVFGWISWQRPGVGWELLQGMDDDLQAYWLSMRAFSGSQMFLEDVLQGRDWFSYPLHIPGGKQGIIELFKVTVTLGDSVARDTLARMLDRGEETWLKHTPPDNGDEKSIHRQWDELHERLKASEPQALAPVHIPPEDDTYHPLVRSCATMVRYGILLTVKRLIANGQRDGVVVEKLPEPLLGTTETWMKELSHTSLKGVFLRAPLAMRYIMRHPESVPPDIPYELDAAGLLQRDNGKRHRIHYSHKGDTPYGQAFFV
jgi:hypothetical protein